MSPRNNIIIRAAADIDRATLVPGALIVTGAASGVHAGELTLARDGKTILFTPSAPFALNETVAVQLAAQPRTRSGERLASLEFSFTISSVDPKVQAARSNLGLHALTGHDVPTLIEASTARPSTSPRTLAACDTFPPGHPTYTTTIDNPEDGNVFLAAFSFGPRSSLMILDNRGEPIFSRNIKGRALDFKRQPNGLLTYVASPSVFIGLDSTYKHVDKWNAGNGYVVDGHEFLLLPNGHALLMIYDPQPVGMDTVVAGGNPNAIVTGLVIQELDTSKNVVFQWRSWDHFQITDVVSPEESLTDSLIDYVHGNSIDVDLDGNLVISSRHLNEVTKINRTTGVVMWRMGLNASQNEFTFVNDTRGFSHQHDARILPNGNLTIYDNGNFLVPEYSRALEYQLDQDNKIATLIWEHRSTPDTDGGFMGNVQRRASGGTMIGWGGNVPDGPFPRVTDLASNGTITYELEFPTGIWTYRAFRFPWRTTRFATSDDQLDFGFVPHGSTVSLPLTITNTSSDSLEITCFTTTDTAFAVAAATPLTLSPGEGQLVQVEYTPAGIGNEVATLYVRAVTDSDLVAQPVELAGSSDVLAVGETPLTFRLYDSSPNPFSAVTTIRYDLPRASRVLLEVFDVAGRKVETVEDALRAPGRHETTWKANGMTSGLYFYRMKAGDFVSTRKLTLMK